MRKPDSTSLPFKFFELKAGLALIRAGSDRDNFTDINDLWKPGDSKPFYRATMSVRRFKFLLRCLRFDNFYTREDRKQDDQFAAIRDIWEMFLLNLRRFYIPDANLTIDEQLLGYRGRVPGRIYMKSKPRKHGLKIFWCCESSTGYALNRIVYGGRRRNQRAHNNLGTDVVMALSEPCFELVEKFALTIFYLP